MKSLGRIAYEEFCKGFFRTMDGWVNLEQKYRDGWEAAAQAVIDEYERRKPENEI
jgi:hypothetical protein